MSFKKAIAPSVKMHGCIAFFYSECDGDSLKDMSFLRKIREVKLSKVIFF